MIYSAFGDNQASSKNNVNYNLRYPGQYYDRETGLHYNYFRTYDPKTGRYTQGDPIGLAGGFNRFGYVNQDGINNFDLFGLSPEDVVKIQNKFREVVGGMIKNGERLPANNFIGGLFNNYFSTENGFEILRKIKGKETLICGEQWDRLYFELIKLKLDDKWIIQDKHSFGHLTGEAISNNPNDPIIKMDPWRNKILLEGGKGAFIRPLN